MHYYMLIDFQLIVIATDEWKFPIPGYNTYWYFYSEQMCLAILLLDGLYISVTSITFHVSLLKRIMYIIYIDTIFWGTKIERYILKEVVKDKVIAMCHKGR